MSASSDNIAEPSVRQRTVDLKWSLMARVVVVALVCFVASALIALYAAKEDAAASNRTVAEAVGKHLDLQLLRIRSALDVKARFPDAEAILVHVLNPGQCVSYVDKKGDTTLSNCVGFSASAAKPPEWFESLFSATPSSKLTIERPVHDQGAIIGKVVVSSDPAAITSVAWTGISRMLALSGLTIVALCVLIYFVIERALQPTKDVIAGLNRLAAGDLSARLPQFRLVELQRIGDVFNELAAKLEATISERAGLARRLVEAQEHERRHLARELHDELAQSLSAMSATAASIKATAVRECPALVPEATSLTCTAADIMKVLRRIMHALRPQEVDELGLLASLHGLIAEFNALAKGRTAFNLNIEGDLQILTLPISIHIYRIAQEGLTNAMKHAEASSVCVVLRILTKPTQASSTGDAIVTLLVEDDGTHRVREPDDTRGFGFGLTGIRERVLALGGEMSFGPRYDSRTGTRLLVVLPLSASEAPTP